MTVSFRSFSALRRNILLTLCLVSALMFSVFPVQAQPLWTAVNAGLFDNASENVPIYCVGANGSTIFASIGSPLGSNDTKLYRSLDNGNSWSQLMGAPASAQFVGFYFQGTTIFAISSFSALFRSLDNGISWQEINFRGNGMLGRAADPNLRTAVATVPYGIVFDGAASTMFVAVSNGVGVARSSDNGATWQNVSNNLPRSGFPPYDYVDMQVTDINVQGSTIFLSSSNKGVFRSTNNGDTWTNIGLTNEQVQSITSSGGIVLAHTINGKVYRSTNSGSSWQLAATLADAFGSVSSGGKLVYGQGTVFAATIGAGIWYSTDDGVAWKRIPDYYVTPLRNATNSFTASANSIFASTINYIPVQANETGVLRMNNYSSLPSTTPPSSISGTIQNNISASLALSGTATNSTNASATGAYSFSGLANGTYTITPTLTGYVFVPSSTSVTISGTSLSSVNFQAFTAPPPAPATVLAFSSVGASSATLTWNPPAGGAQNYIVVVRAGGTPSYTPVNGTSPTGVNSNFTLANPLADDSRIVYDGSGTSISLTGLSPQTSYTVVVFPSNGSGAMRSYQINAPLTGTQSTSALPQLQITPASLDFGSVTVGTVSTGSLTISGTSLLAVVNVTATNPALSLSLTNTPFTTQAVLSLTPTNGVLGATQIFVRFSPSVIGGYAGTLTASSLNATSALVTVNGAGIQSQNQYGIFGSIGIANGVVTLGGAATQSTSASSVGAYSFSTLANGVYTVTPTLTGYVFVPSSTSVTIGGASAYGVNFQPFTVPPSAAATTLVFSSVNASSATIAWNPPVGGAQSYIVVVRPNGTPSYSPANGTTPTGVNSDITLANALADGSRIVYDGSGTSLLLTGLSPQTNYTVVVFPSNGAGAVRSYQTISPLTSSFVTLPPSRITLTPSALDFGSVTLGTVSTASFSVNGDGLTEALVLTSSGASFSLSLSGSPFTTQASLSLVPVSNTILPTTVFVRFTPSVTGASVGAILASGASTATLLLNGTGTTPIPPPVLKAAYAGVRTPIDVTDLQAFTITFRNAANALVDYPGAVDFRGGTPLGTSTGTLTLTRLSLGTYQASSVFTGTGSYTLSLVGVTSTSGTRTFTVQASVNNPVPTLSSIAPATTTATTNTWTLTLNGSNFLPESRVIVDGVTLDQQNVSFVSGALLKAQVVQPLAGIYSVVVENPTPGGGTSLPRTLTVNNPLPRLAAIEPVSVVAGQDAVLTLYGGYFTTATVVRFQNGAVTTTLAVLSLLSPTMATVTIPGSLITVSGTYQIRAHTPVLGGGTSAAENLTVRGAAAVSSEFVNVTTSVVSGANLNAFTVRFRDSFGNLTNVASPVLGYGESTGATTGTIRLKYASTGVSTASATRMDIGGTYSLWINGIGTTTGSRSYTVTGGNDSRVTFSGVPVSVTAGTVVPAFALRFEDAAGNLTDNGVGRLTYARTGGSSTATLALTRLSTGMYTAQSTVCTIAGVYNLAVSSVTPANTFGTKAFTLTPSSFVTVDFVISTSAMTTRGGSISVTANLFDAFGNPTDNLGGYDSLAVIVTNAEFPSSTATVAFARQSLGVYRAQVPVLIPGPYQSKLGGWKKGSELTGDDIITKTFFFLLDLALRITYDVSLSPGLAVRADFANVPTRLYVADTFSPEVDQATVTLRDVRGTRTHLWGGTVGLTINNVPRGTLGTTSNTFSLAELTTTANLAAQLADYGKLYFNPFVVSTLGTYSMALNSTNGTPITAYTGNRTFTVQQQPARLTLTSATLDFSSQFLLAPVTRAYTLRYDDITTNTIVVSATNHPAFLTSSSANGVFTTTESITLTVGGTQPAPASGTATFWVRFLPVQSSNPNVYLYHTSTLASGITAATVRLTLRGAGLVPDVKIVLGTTNLITIPFGQVALGDTRYYGYTMTYRNITASTISVAVPAGNDFAIAQVSSGTWTTAGQTLTLPTVQPATSATTQVQLWARYTPTIAQAPSITLTHLADGGDPGTVASDNLTLTAKKPSLFAVRAVFSGVPAQIRACETLPPFTVALFDASGTPTNWWLDAGGQPTYLSQGENNMALRFVRTGGTENGTIAYSTSGNTITSTGQVLRVTGNYVLSLAANNSSIVTTTGNRAFSVIVGTPSITSFTPQTTSGSCSAGFLQMSIFGCSFANDSRVRIGGLELVPFMVSSTMIVVRIPARLIGLNLKNDDQTVRNQYPFVVTSATLRQAATSSVPLQLTIRATTNQLLALQAPSLGKGGASLQSVNDPQASVKINVYFLSGLVKTSGQPTQVQLPTVSSILNELGIISTFSEQFPNFAESDTVITTWQGARVKQPNLTNQMSISVDSALAQSLIQRLQALPEVLFAEREFEATQTAVPNDPLFAATSPVRTSALNGLYIQLPMDNGAGVLHGGGNLHGQWYLGAQPNFGAHIHATDAWDIYAGSIKDTIGIIELRGLDKNHPDLIDKVTEFTPATAVASSTTPAAQIRDKSHGMWVSSVAAAQGNNGIGVTGVNHHARIVNGIPEELRNIVKRHPQMTILNHSYSGTDIFLNGTPVQDNFAITNRSRYTFAYNNDILSVGSSGNTNNRNITYPAGFGHTVFVVGGTDEYDRRASEPTSGSNYGSLLDMVAPYTRILVATPALSSEHICPIDANLSLYQVHKETTNNAFYTITEGTSFSAPQVSGVASLMVGYARDFKTEDNTSLPLRLHADDVRNLLILSADQIRPDLYIYGVRDKASLSNALGGKPSDEVGKSWNSEVGYGRLNAHRALNLVDKGKLFHVTTGTYSGVFLSSTATTGVFQATIYGVHGVPDGKRWIRCFTVEYNVDFPTATKQYAATNNSTPYIWGNGSLMSDYGITREENLDYPLALKRFQTGAGWCEPVSGTITRTGVTLKTFVYQVYQDEQTPTDTWFPVRWDAVKFAYSAFFPPTTTMALALEKGGGAQVTAQAVPKPLAENAPRGMHIANNLEATIGRAFLTNVTAAPNPLSGQTTISYTALGQCRISLTVLDIYGQPVAEILRNIPHSEGMFSLPCDIAHLASGSYTARIQAITPDGHAHTQFVRLQLVK